MRLRNKNSCDHTVELEKSVVFVAKNSETHITATEEKELKTHPLIEGGVLSIIKVKKGK